MVAGGVAPRNRPVQHPIVMARPRGFAGPESQPTRRAVELDDLSRKAQPDQVNELPFALKPVAIRPEANELLNAEHVSSCSSQEFRRHAIHVERSKGVKRRKVRAGCTGCNRARLQRVAAAGVRSRH